MKSSWWRLFNQTIYIYLISCQVELLSWVELLNQAFQLDSSSWVQLLNLTQHFFQKNFNSTWYFLSQVFNSNSNTQLDAISLLIIEVIDICLKLIVYLDSSAVSYWFIFISKYKWVWKLEELVMIIVK